MSNQPREGMFPPWALWVIGPVTVIAAALIILGVVLGIRAAQGQIETQRRQEVGIALQRAVDFQAEGRLSDAVAEYRRVLMLDPGNETAMAGIQSLVDQATSGEVVVATTPAAGETPVADGGPTAVAGAVIAPTATVAASAETQTLYNQARTVYGTGQWEQAVTLLLQLQQQAPELERSQVEEMLYNAYVNLAAAADQADDLELAISYVDKALALRPNSSALQAARAIAANYVEALNQEGVDWGRAVELYEAVFAQDPNYRDVNARLNAAHFAYGDQLALAKEFCLAEEQYTAALEVSVPAGSIARRDEFQVRCAQLQALRGGTPVPTSTRTAAVVGTPTITPTPMPTSSLATTVDSSTTPDPLLTPGSAISDTAAIETPVVEPEVVEPVAAGPVSGRLLYAALDPALGGSNIYVQGVGAPKPDILFYGATQPAMRPDGQRLVFRNLDNEMRGLTALDPATGLKLRFTTYSEDSVPSWNGLGNYVAFSSNREGDRRWRLYVVWADVNNEATAVGFGLYPDWHPSEDRFAFQGCDESGNGCGIRSINSGGGDNRGITSVAGDMQPDWSPTGQFLVFTSEARDGNPEVYRVDIATGTVTRLTDSGGIDAAPSVSPDGSWVAFLSNRSGAWAVWAVPSSGGEAQQLFALEGNVNVWQEFEMQWIN